VCMEWVDPCEQELLEDLSRCDALASVTEANRDL
jgi:hypothetical protein